VPTDSLTLVGKDAGSSINHNDANGTTAIGAESLALLTNGRYNTAVGFKSLETTANGDRHTAVGYQALGNVTGASDGDNTAIGFNAGHTGTNDLTSGTANTLIGSSTAVSSATGVNQTVIGYNATGLADNSVTLGNSSVTDVYMAQDSGATVHSSALEMSSFKITQKTFVFASGSTHDIGTADANFCGKIKMYTNHNSGAGYIEYSLVYSTNAKALSLINQNQPYFASVVTLTLNSSTGTVSTSSLSYGQGVTVVVESLNEANASFTFA
jgi:hypothetical protein